MFDATLKELRNNKGITQAELARNLDVTQQAVGRWEKAITSPDYETLVKIANFFNVSTDYLLGLSNDPHGTLVPEGKGFFEHYVIDPPPEYYSDPKTRELMEKIQNDPHHRRIFLASKGLTPDELDKIADLMETIINARKPKEESL